jgi:hypothetical protein
VSQAYIYMHPSHDGSYNQVILYWPHSSHRKAHTMRTKMRAKFVIHSHYLTSIFEVCLFAKRWAHELGIFFCAYSGLTNWKFFVPTNGPHSGVDVANVSDANGCLLLICNEIFGYTTIAWSVCCIYTICMHARRAEQVGRRISGFLLYPSKIIITPYVGCKGRREYACVWIATDC